MAEDYGRTVLSRTPLHSRHVDAGAKMADFGGWDMPIEYNGTVAEHASVREAVGIFDVSHMGKVAIFGTGASDFVNSIVANDLDRIGAGQAQYSMVCNDTGGVVDDLIVYKWGDDGVYIVPNAANAATITGIFEAAAVETITVDDQQLTHGIIAVQGPKSADVLSAVDLPTDMDYMAFAVASWRDEPITVCRSGYTGELGFELIAPNSVLGQLWDDLAGAAEGVGGGLAGLGARDTLRTEMGYPLHGQDISPLITPVEAGMAWAVGWDKPAFGGREALVRQRESGPERRLRALRATQRAVPRSHMDVLSSDGATVGEVTSGTFSPTLKEGIALALVDASVSIDDEVVVDVRGRHVPFAVVKVPFVASNVRADG